MASRTIVDPGNRSANCASAGRVRAVPAVDRLVGVADDAQVGASGAPGLEQVQLQGVDVLELVDEEMAELPVLHFGDARVFEHGSCAQDEHVVEVDEGSLALDPLVALVDRGNRARRERRAASRSLGFRRVVRRVDHPRLGPLDLGGDIRRLRRCTGTGAPGRLRDEGRQDRRLAIEQRRRRLALVTPALAQLGEGDRVEGAGGGLAPQSESAEAGAELARGLASERDDEHVAGISGLGGEAIGHPPGEHSGLPGPRPRQDAQRGTCARDRVALGGVEIVEQRVVEPRAGIHRRHLRKGVGHWVGGARGERARLTRACPQGLWKKPDVTVSCLGKTRIGPE